MGSKLVILKDKDFLYRYSRVLFAATFLVLFICFNCMSSDRFWTWRNFKSIVFAAFPLMMVAYGQTMVLLTRGIDVSLGAVVSLANVVCVSLMKPESQTGWVMAVLGAVAAGAACGGLNGFIIAQFRLAPMIVTIAMTVVDSGLALYVMPMPSGSVYSGFGNLMRKTWFNIPLALLFIVILMIAARLLTNSTSFGRQLRAVGGNEESAYSTGINVKWVKIKTYAFSGMFASLGGIFLAAYINSGDPTIGGNYSLNAVAASVIGGTSLIGARGDIIGTVIGVFILSMISNMLNLNGVSSYYQFLIEGFILIFALAISSVKNASD